MSKDRSPMEKVYIVGVEQCNATGAVLRLYVRGHSVEAVFTSERNTKVLPKIKNTLLNTGLSSLTKNDWEIQSKCF